MPARPVSLADGAQPGREEGGSLSARAPSFAIRTPEGIAFHLHLAGPIPRFIAWVLDGLAVLLLASTLTKLASLAIGMGSSAFAAVSVLLYFVFSIGYGIFFEWLWRGQTPGKRVFGLRVLDASGLKLRFSQVAMRNLLRAVDMLPAFYLLGGTVCLVSPRCQRLGDIAANTIVVRAPKLDCPEAEDLTGGKYNSLRDYPHLAARLRQTVTPEEAAIALEALRRARGMENTARAEFFAELAAHFQSIVEFPPEAIEMTSPEQQVRNVVDVIYRPAVE